MGIIARAYSEVDGAIGEASSVNRVIDDLYTLQNQALSSNNFANSGVVAAKLANIAVTGRALDADAIIAAQVWGG